MCTLLVYSSPVLSLILLQAVRYPETFLLAGVLFTDKENYEGISAFIPQCVYFNTAFFVRGREDHFLVMLFNLKQFFSSLVLINNSNLTRFTYLAESFNEQRIFI